jgi:small subunit ribosomal protein S7
MELKIFNKWVSTGILVEDPGLKRYINLNPILVPRTGGKNAFGRFKKSNYHIVERLINKLMIPGHKGKKHKTTSGHCTGKGLTAYKIVERAFNMIEKETKENPIKILVKAIENAAPREEITTIEYGGARYPQALEVAPQRRIDFALRQIIQGSYGKCFGKKTSIERALASEIIAAYNCDQNSQAISKKLELERQADSSK